MKIVSKALILITCFSLLACGPSYKAQPLSFKTPEAYNNAVRAADTAVGGVAFSDPDEAKNAFGFDIRAAGMLPVQLVFDNQGNKTLEINPSQTLLEDNEGNLWPILTEEFAYERATKYAQTKETFKEGAYKGFLGAAAGAVIGAAVGVVSGDLAESVGKGAAVGAAAGATLGGTGAYASDGARSKIVNDLSDKSLENQLITPGNLSHGIIFFPGEAKSAKQLRLQLKEKKSGQVHTVYLKFY